MTMIKAIETKYKGYRFRSRLEARWAVVFDSLGLNWEYEKEGFSLPSGCYLPDFFFPNAVRGGRWVEIKPSEPTPNERQLMTELVKGTGIGGRIICGRPCLGEFAVHFIEDVRSSNLFPGEVFEFRAIFRIWSLDEDGDFPLYRLLSAVFGDQRGLDYRNGNLVEIALKAGLSARFEFGESGMPR